MNFQRHSEHTPFSPSTETSFSPATADTVMEDQSKTKAPTSSFVAFSNVSAETVMEMEIDMKMDMDSASPSSQATVAPLSQTVLQPTTSTSSISSTFSFGTPKSTLTERRAAKSPAFKAKMQQMALPLAPLVQLTTGAVHPAFPNTLLGYWLLTEAELDSLAHFYHQRTPSLWTLKYPCPVTWRADLTLDEKRRKMGKFIGLRGCDTPIRVRSEAELEDEARRTRAAAAEEEVFRRKMHWY